MSGDLLESRSMSGQSLDADRSEAVVANKEVAKCCVFRSGLFPVGVWPLVEKLMCFCDFYTVVFTDTPGPGPLRVVEQTRVKNIKTRRRAPLRLYPTR